MRFMVTRSISRATVIRAAAIGIALVAGACSSDEARVSFTVFPDPDRLEPEMVTVRFTDGGTSRVVAGEDFVGDAGRADTREFETRTRGELTVQVEVFSGTEEVAGGVVVIALQPDWRWNVSVHRSERNPTDGCFGCFGYGAFPIAEGFRVSPADSLWVVWGGNSISSPDVY